MRFWYDIPLPRLYITLVCPVGIALCVPRLYNGILHTDYITVSTDYITVYYIHVLYPSVYGG